MNDETDTGPSRPPAGAIRRALLPLLGTACLATGVVFRIWAALHPATFGWFAYAPLSHTTFRPTTGPSLQSYGTALIAVGLVLLSFWAGHTIGRRNIPAR
ncbi:hypothetical protein GCM10025867_19570 [Frondihabitans sucicola]|uniref:Uncharacterized protein n=1 Tax=Frondihabitans sucicola TaxID=1268041 RepID=A0ABM8GMR6_9MICO|nr:hypothetical protein GCM10025867_19570 [Frondihabitans sucicola]